MKLQYKKKRCEVCKATYRENMQFLGENEIDLHGLSSYRSWG
jgi:hypothetical protein